jgi:hypothetical protein
LQNIRKVVHQINLLQIQQGQKKVAVQAFPPIFVFKSVSSVLQIISPMALRLENGWPASAGEIFEPTFPDEMRVHFPPNLFGSLSRSSYASPEPVDAPLGSEYRAARITSLKRNQCSRTAAPVKLKNLPS